MQTTVSSLATFYSLPLRSVGTTWGESQGGDRPGAIVLGARVPGALACPLCVATALLSCARSKPSGPNARWRNDPRADETPSTPLLWTSRSSSSTAPSDSSRPALRRHACEQRVDPPHAAAVGPAPPTAPHRPPEHRGVPLVGRLLAWERHRRSPPLAQVGWGGLIDSWPGQAWESR